MVLSVFPLGRTTVRRLRAVKDSSIIYLPLNNPDWSHYTDQLEPGPEQQ